MHDRLRPAPARSARVRSLLLCTAWLCAAGFAGSTATAQPTFIEFETGHVRPLALSPDGSQLFVVNTPDNRLEIFDVAGGGLTHVDSVPVGMEPCAVAARNDDEVWVVNHLSDSVSIIDLTANPPAVSRTLLVGDEPRDIVFAGTGGDRAFISTAHRGQHRLDPSISGVWSGPKPADPRLTTEGINRADVWVFDATSLGNTLGGTPVDVLEFFGDTPRALATDGTTVYVAVFHSGNQTTPIIETSVCDGFDSAGPCTIDNPNDAPGGVPGPDEDAGNNAAPESGLIVKFDGTNWKDVNGRNWDQLVRLDLPDNDVFGFNANTLASTVTFDTVGTILFNMAINPDNDKIYVTNTESINNVRFEGPGGGGSTVQGRLSETRVSILNPIGSTVDSQHLNQHIVYANLHTDNPDIVDTTHKNHSLATPLQLAISSDGEDIYIPAFGSATIGVFTKAELEDPGFEGNFDPTAESADYIATDGGPSGVVIDETNNRLYVLTRFNNAVQSISIGTKATLQTLSLHNPESEAIVDGRPFLYDAFDTSGNGEASCASCHIFGDLDSITWNLGDPDGDADNNPNNQPAIIGGNQDFHPMKGPMTTQTLRGLIHSGGMHWRGDRVTGFFGVDLCDNPFGSTCDERHSFKNFIVAFEGLVGHDGLISVADMESFTDFMLTVTLPPNPIRDLSNSLSGASATGDTLFNDNVQQFDANVIGCEQCHALDPSVGFFGTQGAQSFEGETQDFKIPHLRNAYQKIGMFGTSSAGGVDLGPQVRGTGFLHDGAVDTLKNFLASSVFTLSPTQENQIEQFMLRFPSDLAPIVGQQVTLTASSPSAVDDRIDLMIARASVSNFDSIILQNVGHECEVIVKGVVGNVETGWVRESGGLFMNDTGGTITDAALRALATSEGPLTYTCVPPGSGFRMGVERDQDTLLDGVETNTGVFVSGSDTGTDPGNPDTDGDGFDDGLEVAQGSDPNDPTSVPLGNNLPALDGTATVVLVLLLLASAWIVQRSRPARSRSRGR